MTDTVFISSISVSKVLSYLPNWAHSLGLADIYTWRSSSSMWNLLSCFRSDQRRRAVWCSILYWIELIIFLFFTGVELGMLFFNSWSIFWEGNTLLSVGCYVWAVWNGQANTGGALKPIAHLTQCSFGVCQYNQSKMTEHWLSYWIMACPYLLKPSSYRCVVLQARVVGPEASHCYNGVSVKIIII